MFVTKLKPNDEVFPYISGKVFVVCCEGCNQVHSSDTELDIMVDNLSFTRTVVAVTNIPYACNPDNIKLFINNHNNTLKEIDTLLVVSCGVGVQTVASAIGSTDDNGFTRTLLLDGKELCDCEIGVVAACDTYPLPGFQGLTPSKYDCTLCGQCRLNDTAGICPVTACSKSLINGQCGGSKGGMCEVDSTKECGWERINKRISKR